MSPSKVRVLSVPALEATAAPTAAAYKPVCVDPALPPPLSEDRKRPRQQLSGLEYSNSSDPPFFSSDGPDAGAEDYTSVTKRQKRKHNGPWWTSGRATTAPAKRQAFMARRPFQRNFDSGIFMGSDATTTESEDAEDCTQSFGSKARNHAMVPATPPLSAPAGRGPMLDELHRRLSLVGMSPDEHLLEDYLTRQQRAAQVVSNSIEGGRPSIDVMNFGLRVILDSTLRPLHCLVRQEANQPLVPELRLYLGNNNLSHLPSELYSLKYLTELSIRNNQIKKLAPQIGYLPLQSLNISFNQLRYLPFSMLRHFRTAQTRSETINEFLTAQFHLRPNPFLAPVRLDNPASGLSDPTSQPRISPHGHLGLVARSMPCYLSIEGAPLRPSAPWPSQPGSLLRLVNGSGSLATPPSSSSSSSVPSLFELCLRSARQYRRVSTLLTAAAGDGVYVPTSVISALLRAEHASVAGPTLCDICDGEYIVPRGEWLEWYAGVRDNEYELVPLLRRSCSWACVGTVFDEKRVEKSTKVAGKQEEGERHGDVEEEKNHLAEEWARCGWRES